MTFVKNSALTPLDVYRLPASKGDVGIEIELEGRGELGVPCKGWDVHTENSLRAPGGRGHGGAEYVTHGAVTIESVPVLVERLATKLRVEGIVVDENAHRTSTHVHINAQSMPFHDIFGYLTVFSAIEPLFLHLCGPKRDGNAFCVPSYDTGDLPEYLHSFCKLIEGYQSGGGIPGQGRGKYASLSTFRLHDLGTIECRCFPQSLDPMTIQTWCQWLLNLRTIVRDETDKSFRGLIKHGIHDPELLISRVFGNPFSLGVSPALQRELVQYGSREAYELTRILKFWMNKPVSEKKMKEKKDYSIIDDFVGVGWEEHPAPIIGEVGQAPIFRPARVFNPAPLGARRRV